MLVAAPPSRLRMPLLSHQLAARLVYPFCGVINSCNMVQKKGRPSAPLPSTDAQDRPAAPAIRGSAKTFCGRYILAARLRCCFSELKAGDLSQAARAIPERKFSF